MGVFDMLRDQLHMVFFLIPQFVTGRVSLDRVNDFLSNVSCFYSLNFYSSLTCYRPNFWTISLTKILSVYCRV